MRADYITKAVVHDAANRADANGKKATATNVREITGYGSYSTITAYLQSWTPPDQRLNIPPVPEGLSVAVDALTADIWYVARTFAQQETAAQIAQANADVQDAQRAAEHAGKQTDRVAAALAAAQKVVATLEQKVTERDQQINECAEYIRQLEVEAGRKTGEIETLQRTLAQFAPATADTGKTARSKATEHQPTA